MTNPYASSFTARDAISTATSRHGTAAVADPTGTSPMPRPASTYDPALLAAFNAGVQRAARADANACAKCPREFPSVNALAVHDRRTHRPPA